MLKIILLSLIFLMLNDLQAQTPLKARTEKGEWVRINPEGTWNRAKPNTTVKSYTYPEEKADTLLKSKTLKYGTWVDANKWALSGQKINRLSEFEFKLREGDAYSILTYQPSDSVTTLEALVQNALSSVKKIDPDFEVVTKELRYVNNSDVYCVIFKANVNNVKLTYYNYYYSGPAGIIQFVTYCDQNMFNSYKGYFEDLLNGLVIFL